MTDACVCPTCNRELHSRLPLDSLAHLALGPVEYRIVSLLAGIYPNMMTREVMVDRVYSTTADGGPLQATSVVAVAVYRLRKSLKKYGWTISKGKSGKDSPGVRLEPA